MNNERAIHLLHRLQDEQFDGPHGDERREALEMAVRALEGDGDMISRQAAMKEFSDFVRKSNNSDFAQTPTWNDAVSLVGSMPSAQPHWIPCSERLPEKRKGNEDTEYLVTIDNGEFKYVTSDYWINWFGNWRWNDSDAVAWMPFPEPYRGESDEL